MYQPPPPDRRQSERAGAIQRGTCRHLRDMGFAVLPEFTLASNRRADIIAMKSDGEVWIVEIKSSPEDFYADQKWGEYREFCDSFYFAITQEMDASIIPVEAGLIIADGFGAEIVRATPAQPLVAARRKALTISFARTAAQRLHGLWDP